MRHFRVCEAYIGHVIRVIFDTMMVTQSSRGDTPALSLFCDERHESSYFELWQAG
jgi:hypothetical protein